MILPENLQRADERREHAAEAGGGGEIAGLVRFAREQQAGEAGDAADRGAGIGQLPADHRRGREDRYVAEEISRAQAEDIGRSHQVLLFILRAFDAPGIDGDVLRRCGERGEHGECGEHREAAGGAGRGHAENADGHEELPDQHPGPAMAEALADPGQADPVDEGRPQEFGGDEDAHPAHEADGAERDTFRAEPETERHADENRRHAGRDSENHRKGYLGLVQRGQNLPHRRARALRLVLTGDNIGHSSSGAAGAPASPLVRESCDREGCERRNGASRFPDRQAKAEDQGAVTRPSSAEASPARLRTITRP